MNLISKTWFLVREVGLKRLGQNAWYRFQKERGAYQRQNIEVDWDPSTIIPKPIFVLPEKKQIGAADKVLGYADEIVKGTIMVFGALPVPLTFQNSAAQKHWSVTELPDDSDVKLIWEPARFQWVFTLGRAYKLTGDAKYAEAYWRVFNEFQSANPVGLGLHWYSAQEVALRAIAWMFAWQVFSRQDEDTERGNLLLKGIAEHLQRIPQTLTYAQSQENNHLLSEACALYLGGVFLQGYPKATEWKQLGKKWLEWCFTRQIDDQGEYVQHSTNYQRLVLQMALLAWRAANVAGEEFSSKAMIDLKRATLWLGDKVNRVDGTAINFGHNDGANFLEWNPTDFMDYRSTLQSAGFAFANCRFFPSGEWDELGEWLGVEEQGEYKDSIMDQGYRKISSGILTARMRAKQLKNRPGHMDQLHVQAEYDGWEFLLDTGTYSYNLPGIWRNPFLSARNHNCVRIDGVEPMQRAGQFLVLNRGQANWLGEQTPDRLFAFNFGFQRVGVTHYRELTVTENQLICTDTFAGKKNHRKTIEVYWQLPDMRWQAAITTLKLENKCVTLDIANDPLHTLTESISLVRGGKVIFGGEVKDSETLGWRSLTYLAKEPCLTLVHKVTSDLPYVHKTIFNIALK